MLQRLEGGTDGGFAVPVPFHLEHVLSYPDANLVITGECAGGAGEGIRTPEPLRDRSLWTHSIGVFSPAPLTWLGFREKHEFLPPLFQVTRRSSVPQQTKSSTYL